MSKAIIEVSNITNAFGSKCVHDDLSLNVEQGEILALVGGSGSGKTVLLRSMIGLHRPQTGSIRVDGVDLLGDDDEAIGRVRRRLGVLFQRGALYSSLSVLDNILLPLREFTTLSEESIQRLAMVKLHLVGLEPDVAFASVQSLSGGMIKRVALARALALEPDIIFLDEPTAGLDPIAAAAFDQLLRTLTDALQLTIVLVTHDVDSLFAVSDRVAVLSQRKVLVVDTPQAVAAYNDDWVQAYFGGPRGRAAAQEQRSR